MRQQHRTLVQQRVPVRHRTGSDSGHQTVDLPSQPQAIHLSSIACMMASQRHREPASDTSRGSDAGLDASQTSSERSTFERDVPELSPDARALFASYGFTDDDQLKQHLRAVVSSNVKGLASTTARSRRASATKRGRSTPTTASVAGCSSACACRSIPCTAKCEARSAMARACWTLDAAWART